MYFQSKDKESKNLLDYFKQEADDDEAAAEPKSLVERLNLGDSPILKPDAIKQETKKAAAKPADKEPKEKKKRG